MTILRTFKTYPWIYITILNLKYLILCYGSYLFLYDKSPKSLVSYSNNHLFAQNYVHWEFGLDLPG